MLDEHFTTKWEALGPYWNLRQASAGGGATMKLIRYGDDFVVLVRGPPPRGRSAVRRSGHSTSSDAVWRTWRCASPRRRGGPWAGRWGSPPLCGSVARFAGKEESTTTWHRTNEHPICSRKIAPAPRNFVTGRKCPLRSGSSVPVSDRFGLRGRYGPKIRGCAAADFAVSVYYVVFQQHSSKHRPELDYSVCLQIVHWLAHLYRP